MNFTKYTPQQSREFNSKILAWPGAEGDREEGNEDESGQSRSTFKQTEKCWVILKESKRIFFTKKLWQIEHYYFIILYFIFYKASVYFLNIVL